MAVQFNLITGRLWPIDSIGAVAGLEMIEKHCLEVVRYCMCVITMVK